VRYDEARLDTAIKALKGADLDPEQISTSASRVAGRLGLNESVDRVYDLTIENCQDVQGLLHSYRAGILSEAGALLVDAHVRECGSCQSYYQSGRESVVVDWTRPSLATSVAQEKAKTGKSGVKAAKGWGWALEWSWAPAMVVLLCLFLAYKAYWQVPPGVRAEVQSIDGYAYRSSEAGEYRLASGDHINEGDRLRLSGGAHAVLRLSDGSSVEVKERTALQVGARGRSMTVSLDNGAVIVQAALRTSGHLYVRTPDCRVAVTGTVFSVDSGIKGSRVSVLQGSVKVAHAGVDSVIAAGSQMSTSDNLNPEPIQSQIAWSHDQQKYLSVLAQLSILQRSIEQIPFPQPRYASDLLDRMPADTLLYVSIPNLGDFLSQANTIFQDQLKQSPELEQWWDRGQKGDSAQLNSVVEKLHEVSQYLGDEVVIVGVKQADADGKPNFAIVADLQKSGLDDLLRKPFLPGANATLNVLDEQSLNAASASSAEQHGLSVLVRQHEVVFSNSVATLKQLNAQLNSGSKGFAGGDFGKQIQAAYGRGAGMIFAADLQPILSRHFELNASQHGSEVAEKSGIEDVRYLIAEHREKNGLPENHLNLQFSGTRQHVASWLAAPAPIGSLDFVTPNAAIAVAGLSKEPRAIADDLLSMTSGKDGSKEHSIADAEAKMQISIRDDLAANLGGDFLISLDGPVLPTPSWKAVVEVHDSQRLEQTFEQLARFTQSIHDENPDKNSHVMTIDSSTVGSQRFYAIHDSSSNATIAQYTFSDGYMIVAPSRAMLIEALKTHTSGNSLARSAAFKALLPKDANENYSAVAYQNLSPVLTPLLTQFSGESANAIRQLAADARPTAICAWGEDTRIEAASDSRLFGMDFLTLGTLMNSRNNHSAAVVKE
jgi:hypothetical protein